MKFAFLFVLLFVPSILFAQDFTSLTGIPAIQGATTADGFTELLNYIYRLAIGAAAIIAVFQIIRSGFEYLNFESVTDKKNARNRILMAFGGLLLALSPVIVFSVIDQRIYSLELNVEPLQVQTGQIQMLSTSTSPGRYEGPPSCSAEIRGQLQNQANQQSSGGTTISIPLPQGASVRCCSEISVSGNRCIHVAGQGNAFCECRGQEYELERFTTRVGSENYAFIGGGSIYRSQADCQQSQNVNESYLRTGIQGDRIRCDVGGFLGMFQNSGAAACTSFLNAVKAGTQPAFTVTSVSGQRCRAL